MVALNKALPPSGESTLTAFKQKSADYSVLEVLARTATYLFLKNLMK